MMDSETFEGRSRVGVRTEPTRREDLLNLNIGGHSPFVANWQKKLARMRADNPLVHRSWKGPFAGRGV